MKKLSAIFIACLYTLSVLSAGILGGIAGDFAVSDRTTGYHEFSFEKDAPGPSPLALHHWQPTGIAHPHLAQRLSLPLHLPAYTQVYRPFFNEVKGVLPLHPQNLQQNTIPVYKLHCVYRI
ncbi:MAG TPA: hypothetical protein VL307_15995 [Chitinophagaceae bacterium]|nr:hypothetical protein [Chitinophagaceae bacterium]